ncbi:MAG: hypothetical protein K5989_02140 [Lachnospiraceae bacterium]|nr:hypothetical protein [Lachnospiraceae bacterium]
MKMKFRLFMCTCLAVILSIGLIGCGGKAGGSGGQTDGKASVDNSGNGGQSGAQEAKADLPEDLTIGVSVYNTEDAEVEAFRNYFQGYLGPAFDVKFLYSDSILEAEEEINFIESLHEQGVTGIISFLSTDLEKVLPKCDELGMVYMRGSGSISNEAFQKASAHNSFLGIIGPDVTLEQKAGYDMAGFFAEESEGESLHYLILSGGGCIGNEMHAERAAGMLKALADKYGLTYSRGASELARSSVVQTLGEEGDSVRITLVPGYIRGNTLDRFNEVLEQNDFDVTMGVLALNTLMPELEAAEKRAGKNMRIGMVDSFTEQNYEWFHTKDNFGNPTIDYVTGKYSATVGPSFAAMYNACTGQGDFLKVDGKPFRLVQNFWTASDGQTFEKFYNRSINVYDNTYSTKDLRKVIRLYTPAATFEEFKELTERDNTLDFK